ncbi:mitochondrial ribosomal protein L49 [Lycorma delicatula]|uniref:mitochondrial ribosomal protein L49 n=1 Tax=Lycorma delicatula TaxID=130591 RepID=UPI003F510C66
MLLRPFLQNIKTIANSTLPSRAALFYNQKSHYSAYGASKPEGDPKQYTDYEIIKNPDEWKYVERLLPISLIPEPPLKENYPSGWKPATAKAEDYPYFVERTKNHLVPVYLKIDKRGTRRLTKVRRISGDIWHLKELLVKYLEHVNKKPVGVRVDEISGVITFRGDYCSDVKEWLLKKGL